MAPLSKAVCPLESKAGRFPDATEIR